MTSIPAGAAVDEDVAPKAKEGAAVLPAELNMKGWAGVAEGAAGVSCVCCPKRKAFAGGASVVAVLWPNMKVLVGAGTGAGTGDGARVVVELATAPNRLGCGGGVEEGVLEVAAAMKPKAGFAADESVQRKG